MSDKVIVILDRDEAEGLTTDPSESSGSDNRNRRAGKVKVRAALDRDPDALVEQVAAAMLVAGWPSETPLREGSEQHQFLVRLARAALAAITKGEA